MPKKIGPHLLGRLPRIEDEKDYKLENFLGIGLPLGKLVDPLQLAEDALNEAKQTTVSYKKWAATSYKDVTQTHWWKLLNDLNQIIGNPAPTPPPSGNKIWNDPDKPLDQGDYGTCVGNGCAQFGNTDPIEDHYTETDARSIYYEATILDGSPDDPDSTGGGQQGATVKSGIIALKNRGRVGTYAVTTSVDSVQTWLQTKGPVVFGSVWTNDMFYPDNLGYIVPMGPVAGGHCYLAVGDLPDEGAILFLNSWGNSWGLGGYFKMKYQDVQTLLDQQGEAWVSVELSL